MPTFLTGTLLNVLAVVIGATAGLVIRGRMPDRVRSGLTDGLGIFTIVLGLHLALGVFTDPLAVPGDELVVLGALLGGIVAGELLRIPERLDGLGEWLQDRLSRGDRPSPVSEGFVTASLVFCVGPLTIVGSIQNGLTGDVQLLAVKSLLDGVASVAFAAALGVGVYLSALTVLVVQGGIAAAASILGAGLSEHAIVVTSATGGSILFAVGIRLLELRRIRVASFLPALVLAPILLAAADAMRGGSGS